MQPRPIDKVFVACIIKDEDIDTQAFFRTVNVVHEASTDKHRANLERLRTMVPYGGEPN